MLRRSLGDNGGRIIVAVLLLIVGGCYLLRNTLGVDLGDLDGEAIWPVIAILFGLLILYRSLAPRHP